MDSIDLYTAIKEMRKITEEGGAFALVYMTYNRERCESHGMKMVRSAKLRPAARKEQVVNAEYKLFYYDMDEMEARVCWQMLIMYFNGKKVILN